MSTIRPKPPPCALRLCARAAFRTVTVSFVFLHSDRKAGEQTGDQTDGKLKDSKERWVLWGQQLCSPGWFLLPPNHYPRPLSPNLKLSQLIRQHWLRPAVYADALPMCRCPACLVHGLCLCVKVLQESMLVFLRIKKRAKKETNSLR